MHHKHSIFSHEKLYSLMQSDRNSSKTDTLLKPTTIDITYEPDVQTTFEEIINFLGTNMDE